MEQYPEDSLVPISALQHLLYCERQCALIHLEGVWNENEFTAMGRSFHNRAHDGETEVRGTTVLSFGVPVRSLRCGLAGRLDALEVTYRDRTLSVPVEARPVEYKVGKPKKGKHDIIQLGAQALCVEEMLGVEVPAASVFYGKTRRRIEVAIDDDLRIRVRAVAVRLHALINDEVTPPPRYQPELCDKCSLFEICGPKAIEKKSVASFVHRSIARALQE
jgi:CRISPR-associated exonuclease Cas4